MGVPQAMILWCGGGGRFSEPTSFAGVDPPLYYLFLLNDKQVGSYNLPKTPPSRFVPLLSQRTVSTRLVSRRVQVRHHVISYRCTTLVSHLQVRHHVISFWGGRFCPSPRHCGPRVHGSTTAGARGARAINGNTHGSFYASPS